jgi:hypothetical protein
MNLKFLKIFYIAAILILLGNKVQANDGAIQVKRLYDNYLLASHKYNVVHAGEVSGNKISGLSSHGFESAINSQFEGMPALMVREFRLGGISVAGIAIAANSEIKSYYDKSNQYLGFVQSDGGTGKVQSYGVVTKRINGLPENAKIGTQGLLWSLKVYGDSLKKSSPVSLVATWRLKPPTKEYTAILEFVNIYTSDNKDVSWTDFKEFGLIDNDRMVLIGAKNIIKNGSTVFTQTIDTFSELK